MIPASFEYFAPASVSEALALIEQYRDEAKVLSGGHSLIPLMKLRLAQPKYLIDIGKIAGLNAIRETGGALSIGSLARHADVHRSALVKEKCPLLAETAGEIGDPQVRNRGTIGGSIAHADPAADWPAAMLALSAEIHAQGPNGSRVIPAAEFFVDVLTSSMEQNEILTEVRIPIPRTPPASSYMKIPQSASGFAIVGVAVQLDLDAGKVCRSAAVAITGLASKAFRAVETEHSLRGKALDEGAIQAAAALATSGIDSPLEDLHASGEFRLHLARVQTARAISKALGRG